MSKISKFNINYYIKIISLFFIFFSISILLIKNYYLLKTGNDIGVELIAQAFLTERGHEIQNSIHNDRNFISIPCDKNKKCTNELNEFDQSYLKNIFGFLQASSNNSNRDWVVENNLSMNSLSEYRGFYLHHYQTILYPIREINAGEYSAIFTSQYGFVSLIPAILIGNNPFFWYPALSIALLIFLMLIIFLSKRSDSSAIIIAGICLLVALSMNLGAIKLSPGFSIYRIAPTWVLMYLSFKSLINEKSKFSFFIGLILALINSLQMNLLVVIINVFTASLLKIKGSKTNNILIFTLPVCIALVCQYLTYQISSDDFSQQIFSSLEQSKKNYLYVVLILLFPFTIFITKKLLNKNQSSADIFCYFCYLGLSTYPISFPGSPQHFCSFIIMASFPIYLLATEVTKKSYLGIILLSPLFITAYHYNYLKLPNHVVTHAPSFFVNKEFGSELTFSTPSNIDLIFKQYKGLINPYGSDGEVLNLTSDSKYFSAVSGKNPPQKNYDLYIFTPKLNINSLAFKEKLVKNRIKFIVIYSPFFLKNLHDYLKYKLSVTTEPSFQSELKFHLSIIEEQISLSSNKLYNLKECRDRYCIYQL